MIYLLPVPDAQGIAKTRELYLNRFGTEIDEEQAADVLGRVMRLLYLLSETPIASPTADDPITT